MSWIWMIFLTFSLLCALFTRQIQSLSQAMLEGASQGISLGISLAGPLCLWNGFIRVMEASGLSDRLALLLRPLQQRLFPRAWTDPTAREALCGNLTANLLGLGNAATPFGIQASRQMAQLAQGQTPDELCRLVVMNTASVQLIPSTVAAIRSGLGASASFDILPAVWITSLCSVTAGLLAAKVLSRWL